MPTLRKAKLLKWTIRFHNLEGETEVAVLYGPNQTKVLEVLGSRVRKLIHIDQTIETNIYEHHKEAEYVLVRQDRGFTFPGGKGKGHRQED